jgi:hypothetical protein
MSAKIYKAIFRLDYPLSYSIVDRLGEYCEFINNKTAHEPFAESKGVIEMNRHLIIFDSKINDDRCVLNLDIKSFNSGIDFPKGCDISSLARFPLFSLADEVIEKLEQNSKIKYDRIGFRIFLLIEDEKLKFANLLDYIWDNNVIFTEAFKDHYPQRDDIGLVYEASAKDNEKIRLSLGPYQKQESKRYFSLENDVQEGIIFDIDISQTKINLPKLNLVKFIHKYQKTYEHFVGYTIEQFKKEGILT